MALDIPLPKFGEYTIGSIYNAMADEALKQRQANLQNNLLEMQNKLYEPSKKAEISQAEASAAKANALLDIMKRFKPIEGQSAAAPIQSGVQQQPLSLAQAGINSFNQVPEQLMQQQFPVQNGVFNQPKRQQQPPISYGEAALLSQAYGLKAPDIQTDPITGDKVAITPFGNIPLLAGLSPQKEAYEKGKGKFASQQYGEAVQTVRNLDNQSYALDELIKGIDNPEFRKVTGPISSFLTKWAGTPQQRQLLGQLQSASGEIALQVMPGVKGAWTGKDQALIDSIKANPKTDFPDIFIGKLKAQKLISEALKERASLVANYIDQGMSPLEAEKRASKEAPLDRFRPQIEALIDPMTTIYNKKTGEEKKVRFSEAQKLMGK